MRLLSGKVRLTGLRTTGSDGEESGKRGGRHTGGGDWFGLKREMARVQTVEETDNEIGVNSFKRQRHFMKVKGRGRHEMSGCHRGAPGDKGDPDANRERPIQKRRGEPYLIYSLH